MITREFANPAISFCLIASGCLVWLIGCQGKPSAVPESEVDPPEAAQSALDTYDQNQDGLLSKTELELCAGIRKAIGAYDRDQDGSVSKKELEDRFRSWVESRTRISAVTCIVHWNGSPMEGASVKLIPEPFLKGKISPGSGETRGNGRAILTSSDADLPPAWKGLRGMQLGLYQVEITHPNIDIPAKYNTKTTLGQEINPSTPGAPILFDLTSQ
ncbi:MAG: hypothetical protein JW829_06290 [Pirellulales bacterium]|nr:hypothetical protein [Pirellulales bacterium]